MYMNMYMYLLHATSLICILCRVVTDTVHHVDPNQSIGMKSMAGACSDMPRSYPGDAWCKSYPGYKNCKSEAFNRRHLDGIIAMILIFSIYYI